MTIETSNALDQRARRAADAAADRTRELMGDSLPEAQVIPLRA
jgi:hypothetical protein